MDDTHPLANVTFQPCERRVYMIAGSDLEMPFPPFGFAEHRLILAEDARPEPWQLENLVGWHIRLVSPEPGWRLLVADDWAQLVELDEAYQVKSLYVVKDDDVEKLVAFFEDIWSAGTEYELPVRGIPATKGDPLVDPSEYWDEAIARLASHPAELRELESDHFEHLVAELLRRDGFHVQLTPPTRDGGRDILAWSTSATGRTLSLVECKRYGSERKVDVRAVRALFGVLEEERATNAMIVTTSSFTEPARRFRKSIAKRLVLRDYGDLAKWLRRAADEIANKHSNRRSWP